MEVFPLERKKEYVEFLGSSRGINLSMFKWGFLLPDIWLHTSFNIFFKFMLNFNFALAFHFPTWGFEFALPIFPIVIPLVDKARYGVSKFDESVYDPEQVLPFNLENAIWNLRYKTTEKDSLFWKGASESLRKMVDQLRATLKKHDVAEFYADGIINNLALIEGKVLDTAYAGFSIVDIAKVGKPFLERGRFSFRLPKDWKTTTEFETYSPYEAHVDYSLVGYCRVISKKEGIGLVYLREVSKWLVDTINGFHMRTGKLFVEVSPPIYQVNYQRIFFYQRENRLHWTGGKHQLRLQTTINNVKRLLDQEGIVI